MESNSRVIATWLVSDDLGQETLFPQNAGKSSSWNFQAVYWRCVVVFFYSSRLVNPTARRVLFLNRSPRSEAKAFISQLMRLGVEIVEVPFSRRPPEGFTSRFGNQFYIFDLLAWMADRPAQETWLILDSDCVWQRELPERLPFPHGEPAILTYDVGYSPSHNINGLTREQLTKIAREEGWRTGDSVVPYCGGEFFAAQAGAVSQSLHDFEVIRARCVERWAEKRITVKEEAHVLSLVYSALGLTPGSADGLTRRIWTGFGYRNTRESDRKLPLWHLPAEKRTGLTQLYYRISADLAREINPSVAEWSRCVGRLCGVPRRGPAKIARDLHAKIFAKLTIS